MQCAAVKMNSLEMMAQPQKCFEELCKEHMYGAKLSSISFPPTIRLEIGT